MKLHDKLESLILTKRKVRVRLFLFFDYDGTLTPIVDRPEKAFLPTVTKNLLEKAKRSAGVVTSVISGRQLSDLEKRVGIRGLVYVGNHGLEMKARKWRWVHPGAKRFQSVVKKVIAELEPRTRAIDGAVLENKTFGLSLHYRLVPKKKIPALYASFNKAIEPWISHKKARCAEGKKVWEVRPPFDWSKGTAVLKLLERYRWSNRDVVLYFGDDQTDEDAFRILKHQALTVRVGKGDETSARYVLKNSQEVGKLLGQLLRLRNCR